MSTKAKHSLIFGIILFGVAFTIGILIGHFAISKSTPPVITPEEDTYLKNPEFSKKLQTEINKDNIRDHIRLLSKTPQVAGLERDLTGAQYIEQLWKEHKLDSVNIVPYKVLLNYPNKDKPNKVQLLGNDDSVLINANLREKIYRPDDENEKDVLPAYVAYVKAATVKGKLVYANYGTIEDFQKLQELQVSCDGHIVIVRYGKIFRAEKIKHAAQAKAIGVLMYLDPDDVAPFGTAEKDVYPNTWWLPGTGIQRGTTTTNKGDQLTQGYPALDYAYRPDISEIKLASIPAQPIGYEDAQKFLSIIAGPSPPKGWSGALNANYSLGPDFIASHNSSTVRLEVNSDYEIKETYNVIGIIHGNIEPDRYVILGNHRDSWSYGAVDPVSGTGILLELTRVFGKYVQEGWRPRRSLLFCNWGAEEFGLVGSYEWVEENVKVLFNRAVAYLNVDYGAKGNASLQGRANSILRHALVHATQKVQDPHDSSRTVFQTWQDNSKLDDDKIPIISGLGSGSDFLPFIQATAVPAADIRYTYSKDLKTSSYPAYHTMYEGFYYLDTFVDPGFHCHLAVARVWAEFAYYLAESLILPLNINDYTADMKVFYNNVEKSYSKVLIEANVTLAHLLSSIENFASASSMFYTNLEKNKPFNSPLEVRMINDQLMLVEKAFYYPVGLPGRPEFKHLIFAPSTHDSYKAANFPGLSDLLYGIDTLNGTEKIQRWKDVKKHLTILTHAVQSAADILKPYDKWALGRNS